MVSTTYQEEADTLEQKFSVSSSEEGQCNSVKRPKTPVSLEFSETQTNWTKSLPLPTPEEKMCQKAHTVQTDVIPINITGETFDRQASFRRSLIHTDTVVRCPKKVKRRKTITGVPDNIQKELAGTGHTGLRWHSMLIPDHFNTLEHCHHSTQQLDTRDFSCQTDEIKIVPPSVRRIRAQKGQGIAALMSSSSGNMSTLSDSAACSSHLNGNLHFRSLPRIGARVSLQSLDQCNDNYSLMEESFNTLPWQVNRLQMDDTNVHLTNNHRSTVLQRPKSHEVKCCESEISSSPACMVSPHAAYSTSIIPNAMLSYSSELISIHTPHSSGLLDRKPTVHSSSSNRKGFTSGIADNHHSSCGNWSENSSSRSSQIHVTGSSICKIGDVPHNIPCKINIGFNNHSFDSHSQSELSYSDGHQRNASITSSINSADNWFYNSRDNHSAPTKKLSSVISGCPMSTMNSCSSKRKADSCSLYSLDQDGFSIHIDSGISLADQSQINGIEKLHYSVINMFDIKEMSDIEVKTGCNNKPLPHSISLKKSKKPPQPPSRTDSLRRLSAKVIQTNRQVLNETFIATLQQSLPLNLKCKSTGSPLQSSPCSDYADPWILHSCSQSTVSANSSGISVVAPNMYSICTVTPSQSESSSMKSEYSDQWSCFIDYCQTPTEQPKSSKHNLSSPAGLNKYNARKSSYGIRTSAPQGHTGSGKGFSSSEKTRRVASPSSGYSSQSNTPTTLTPVPLLSKNMSQVNVKYKMKPKVPERRSSLVSSVSVSSSSTSLSSNTSDSLQQSMQFSNVMLSTHALSTPPLTPDLPPSPTMDATDTGSLECSPKFPPPPLEVTMLTDHDLDLWLSCSSQNTAMSKPMDSLPYPPSPLVTMMHSMLPSPASPLITKVLNIGTEQFSLKNADCSNFLNDHSKQELLKPTVPIVTAHALQMVHLRSVKKTSQPETEQIAEYMPESCLHDEASALFIQQSLVPSASPELKSTENQTENTNYNMPAQQVLSCGFQSNAPQLTFGEIEADKAHKEHIEEFKNSAYTVNSSSHEKQSISQSTPNSFLNKNSPSVSKKPKLLLIFPPPQLDLAAEKLAQVNENVKSMPNFFETDTISELCESDENYRKKAEDIEEQTSGLVYQEQEAWFSPCKLNKNRVFILPPVPEMQNHQQKEEQQSISDELNIYINISENTSCNQNTFQDDDTAEVFNNDTANSPLWTSSDIMSNEEVTTPARPVTTEDLFARIHKSKRKVLGRKDSDDDSYRNLSSSPPVTPTGNTHLSSFKQTGSIQRSVRKTMTSSDSFKALLLKKGSRSETGFRMSAAEMLKHTDPRFQRSRSDSSLEFPESPTFPSPNKNRKVQEEWAKNEGLMPRNMSVSGIRYSRARTPPSAASSKYNVRSRLQSSPMTVICEGEGEGVETVENSFSKGPPLLNTESLDMCYNTDSEINKKDDEQVTNNIVHINLNILLEKSIEDDSGCIEEII